MTDQTISYVIQSHLGHPMDQLRKAAQNHPEARNILVYLEDCTDCQYIYDTLTGEQLPTFRFTDLAETIEERKDLVLPPQI